MNFDDDIWLQQKKFVIFGAGTYGKKLVNLYERYNIFLAFIDNDIEKQKTECLNIPIISFEEYLNRYYNKYKIILACSIENKEVIENQMATADLEPKVDFIYIDEFLDRFKHNFPYYSFKYFNEIYINMAQICVTERCTLKCKKCAHGCYNVPNNTKDMDLSEVKKSADTFFTHIDYVERFDLIGGEPFLYSDLSEAIIYIGKKYRNQIKKFCITTNGTIIPKEEILEKIKKYSMRIDISDYSNTLPRLKSQYEKLTQTFKTHDICYFINNADRWWTDYGFDHVDRGFFKDNANKQEKTEELKKVFAACKTPCREIRGNKLYFCVQARTCNDNLHFNVGKDDYLDFDKLGNDYESKKIILDLEMGNIPKGYLDMCNYCNGNDRFKFPIHAAEQI